MLKLRNNWGEIKVDFSEFCAWAAMFRKGVVVRESGSKIFAFFKGGLFLAPHLLRPSFMAEPYEDVYHDFDFRGKRVLDVGGYLGETAYLFHKWGVAHVTVYEPDPTLGKFVELNLRINRVNGGFRPLFVDACCSSKSVDWNTVLSEKFDIAKVDCEGCEVHLVDVSDELLRSVPEWVIECHSPTILYKLWQKFSSAGFSVYYRNYFWCGTYYVPGKKSSLKNAPKTLETLFYAKYIPSSSSRAVVTST
ncbi:MAG: hypothetical protein QXT91_01875 [Candidatus Caldarchaeum sp.]